MNSIQHFDNTGTARFITIVCHRRLKLFEDSGACRLFCVHIEQFRLTFGIKVFALVIMPDHVHLVIHPNKVIVISRAIGQLKSKFAFEIIQKWKVLNAPILGKLATPTRSRQEYAFWQPRCHDYNCRTPESIMTKIKYCHANPVRAGLVATPEEWPWSSYRWYSGDGESLIKLDSLQDLI